MLPAAAHQLKPPVTSKPLPKVKTSGKILVIDDEEMILSVVGSMFNTLGYECALVQEGIEGSRQYIRARADGNHELNGLFLKIVRMGFCLFRTKADISFRIRRYVSNE
jgi:hypothetical protein